MREIEESAAMPPQKDTTETGQKCRRCGEPLDDLCRDCQETELSEAIATAMRERQKSARHFKLVPCDEERKECRHEDTQF